MWSRTRDWRGPGCSCLCLLLLAAAAGGCRRAGPAPTARPEEDRALARRLHEQAGQAAMRGDIDGALVLSDAAVRAAPSRVPPYLLRAQLLERAMRYPEARRDLETAHRLAPREVQITLDLLRMSPPYQYAEQIERLSRDVVRSHPEVPMAHYYLAVALSNSPDARRWDEARREFEAAHRLMPADIRPVIELGKLAARQQRNREATEWLEKAWHMLAPVNPHLSLNLPPREQRAYRQAVAFWLKELYRRQGDRRLARISATLASLNRQVQQLAVVRERARSTPPNWAAKRAAARLALAEVDLPEALGYARQLLSHDPADTEARRIAAEAAARLETGLRGTAGQP